MSIFSPASHPGIFATSGTAAERLWYPDILARVWADAGLYNIEISNSAPVDTAKIWFDPDDGNAAPGAFKYWDGSAWAAMTATEFARINKGTTSIVPGGGGVLHEQALSKPSLFVCDYDLTINKTSGNLLNQYEVYLQLSPNNGTTWLDAVVMNEVDRVAPFSMRVKRGFFVEVATMDNGINKLAFNTTAFSCNGGTITHAGTSTFSTSTTAVTTLKIRVLGRATGSAAGNATLHSFRFVEV